MTERLYYTDAAMREFTARVVSLRDSDRGTAVCLDRTAFYPTSGGQPYDTGTLDHSAVIDVWEDDDGEIWHLVEDAPSGDEVRGEIDWTRRFDHMQQHSGQHLLSAAFVLLLDAPTLSFHLGKHESSIDLDIAELSWEAAFRVEAEVNRVIWDNRPVEVHIVDEREVHRFPLRKPPTVSGDIRVVWIRDYDASACGGTHVGRTGAIGSVKVTRIERYKGGTRVCFLCGGRALNDYQRVLRSIQQVSADLSVHPDELADAVVRLRNEGRDSRRELKAARKALTSLEAERLWSDSPETGGVRRVIAHLEDVSFDQARTIAAQLGARPKTLVLLAISDAKGTRLVGQRSDDLPQLNLAEILGAAAESLGGRGGGSQTQAQGGAPLRPSKTVLEALMKSGGK